MLAISLDLGKVPSVLAALADQANAQAVVNAAAEAFVKDTHEWIKSGNAFTPRTGRLEQSIGWHPNGDGSADVYANADYAPYVEYGTGPRVISARPGRDGVKVRAPGVGYVLARESNHPGSKPHPFFFADLDTRQQHMQQRALSVLAARLATAGA